MTAHRASEIIGGILLLLGMVCVGMLLRDQYPDGGKSLPQYALSLTFLGLLLWSIGRSGQRGDG